MSYYKEVDLFGCEIIKPINGRSKKRNLFTDYESFVDKFEVKKTTDDCYTPPEVYKIVLDYVAKKTDITKSIIIRPFFPGGDFEAIEYPENCLVIDNPPFSIISKIVRFYLSHKVQFFLFAPHLTLFGADLDCTHIVVGGEITYSNGALVKTSFLSNMFGDAKIIGEPELYNEFKQLNNKNKANLPKYEYPSNVVTVSGIQYLVEKGFSIKIDKHHARHYRALQSQKSVGKAIFGSGFLISNLAAQEKAAQEKAAQEKAAQEKAAQEKDNVITWELCEKEKNIIQSLG